MRAFWQLSPDSFEKERSCHRSPIAFAPVLVKCLLPPICPCHRYLYLEVVQPGVSCSRKTLTRSFVSQVSTSVNKRTLTSEVAWSGIQLGAANLTNTSVDLTLWSCLRESEELAHRELAICLIHLNAPRRAVWQFEWVLKKAKILAELGLVMAQTAQG